MLVSVVIPTYGRSEMLERAISSVLNQTYKNVEIIIIDDNGLGTVQQKATEKILSEYIDKSSIVYVVHEKNAGGCAARNSGIRDSNGAFIGFLDDDDEWLPLFIEKHLEKMQDDADVVYCNYYTTSDSSGKNRLKKYTDNKIGYVFDYLLTGWCPSTTSMFLVKKECFQKSGYFDESLQSFQDYDMWLTLAREHTFACCEEYLIVKYQHGFEQLASNPIKRQHALDTLAKKWKILLKESELEVFEKTIEKFQKKIYEIEFAKLRNEGLYIKSLKKSMQILKMGNNKIKDIVELIITLIFGIKVIPNIRLLKQYIKFKIRY